MIHADVANVSKADIKAKLSKMLKCKEDALVVFGLKTKFGGGRSSGFALVYDNADAKKKYDLKKRLMSVSSPNQFYQNNIAFRGVRTFFWYSSFPYLLGKNYSLRSQPT